MTAVKKQSTSNCETCANYFYDDQTDSYCCGIDLDEDEMQRFITFCTFNCPYYTFGDEYTIVRRQN